LRFLVAPGHPVEISRSDKPAHLTLLGIDPPWPFSLEKQLTGAQRFSQPAGRGPMVQHEGEAARQDLVAQRRPVVERDRDLPTFAAKRTRYRETLWNAASADFSFRDASDRCDEPMRLLPRAKPIEVDVAVDRYGDAFGDQARHGPLRPGQTLAPTSLLR